MINLPFFPPQASTVAWQVDLLFLVLVGLSSFFSLIVLFLIVYFGIRYWRGREADRTGAPESNTRMEIGWMLGLLVLGIGTFTWAAKIYIDMTRPPEDALEVYLVGRQWMWKFQHPEGPREINELHVPVGRPVRLIMTSQDVIHSFYVPAFRLKHDVLPGRYTNLWFEATQTGEYHLFCAEFCGTQHSEMIGTVVVMEPRAYQEWLSERTSNGAAGDMAATGAQLYEELGCSGCHEPDSDVRAPRLAGVFGSQVMLANGESVTADENYLRESIILPQAKIVAGFDAIMPSFQDQVSEEQLTLLVDYIKSLGDSPTPESNP